MDVSPSERPRRAERESVAAARYGRRAVEPIAGEIVGWHDRTARLWARFTYLESRGKPTHQLLDAVDALLSEVADKTEAWQASLDGHDSSGRVSDAQKSFGGVVESLTRLRDRINRHLS